MLEQVGRYKVIELLGEGAMAEVYKAYDPEIGRTLALKILKPQWCQDEEYLHRFLREAKAAGAFSHPNIVTVYDVGQIDNRPYIVMELVEGTPLGDDVQPGKPVSLKQTLNIGIQLAEALSYAHSRGVVHRDIKPNNILLMTDRRTIKIADFGIAHMEDPDAAQQTQVGTVLGTPQYMSPEQVMGHKVDARSDLFSVGVILYQLSTGEKPFDANTMATLLYKITQDEPEPIAKAAPDLPAGLIHIISKLLSKPPERRFQSGDELAKALRHELSALDEQASGREKRRIIPISVRWTLLSASIVAATMAVSIFFIEAKQNQELRQFAINSGVSLSKFIAAETADKVLGEEWVAIEIFVNAAVRGQRFDYLAVLDHKGIVRGSNNPAVLNKPFSTPEGASPISETDGVRVSRVTNSSDEIPVLGFAAPILFQGKEIGRVHLGLIQNSLKDVVDTTRLLLVALGIVTVLAVGLVSYVLAQLLSRPIRTLRTSLEEVAKGNYNARLPETRNDELGQLFAAYNSMAESLGEDNEPILPQ